MDHTKYSSEEIAEWFRLDYHHNKEHNAVICDVISGFIEDNPDGTLTKVKMLEMYSSVLSVAKATMFVDQIFTKFDTDNDGFIDFKVIILQ